LIELPLEERLKIQFNTATFLHGTPWGQSSDSQVLVFQFKPKTAPPYKKGGLVTSIMNVIPKRPPETKEILQESRVVRQGGVVLKIIERRGAWERGRGKTIRRGDAGTRGRGVPTSGYIHRRLATSLIAMPSQVGYKVASRRDKRGKIQEEDNFRFEISVLKGFPRLKPFFRRR